MSVHKFAVGCCDCDEEPTGCGTWKVTVTGPCSLAIVGATVTIKKGTTTISTGSTDSSGEATLPYETSGWHTLEVTCGNKTKSILQNLTCPFSPVSIQTWTAEELLESLEDTLTLTTPLHVVTLNRTAPDTFEGTGTVAVTGVADCDVNTPIALNLEITYILSVCDTDSDKFQIFAGWRVCPEGEPAEGAYTNDWPIFTQQIEGCSCPELASCGLPDMAFTPTEFLPPYSSTADWYLTE